MPRKKQETALATIEAEFTEEPGQKPPEPETTAEAKRIGWRYAGNERVEIQPEWPEMLVAHMSQGLSFDSFAGHPKVLISRSLLYELVDAKRGDPLTPALKNAKEVGEVACLYWWEYQGQQGLWGGADFKPPMWIYNMKCRFREQWHDRFENITDPAQLVAVAITQFHEMQAVMAGPEPAKTP